MVRGPRKHLKRLNAPKHWMLDKLGGVFAPRQSCGPHKLRECLPLMVFLRNRLKYALTYQEVIKILAQRLIKVDGKVRTDKTYPAGFMDVITIDRTAQNFRLIYDVKGRFTVHQITPQEAEVFALCKKTIEQLDMPPTDDIIIEKMCEEARINLSWLSKVLLSLPDEAVNRSFECLLEKLVEEAKGEVQLCKSKAVVKRKCLFGWLKAVIKKLQQDHLESLLKTIVTPLMREIHTQCTDDSNIAKSVMEALATCVNKEILEEHKKAFLQAQKDKRKRRKQEKRKALNEAGIECPYVTGGGTDTYLYEAASGVFTEIQPGSYIFMDVDYWNNKGNGGEEHFEFFKHSLFVLTTVQSVTGSVRAVGDAGLKAVSFDSGPPMIHKHPSVDYSNGGNEHGIITPAEELKVGDQLKLVPGHCDPTVYMYEWLVAVHGDTVQAVWPVLGRGPGV